MMFGYNKKYEALLKEANIETLSARRTKALCSFAEKCLKSELYSDLFPKIVHTSALTTRNRKTFVEKFARSDRLYKSPVYTMRRLLNNTPDIDRFNNPTEIDLSHLFNDPFTV